MKKLVFIYNHICDASDRLDDCIIVPLNPAAMAWVLDNKLPFVKLDDYFDYAFVKQNTEKIWRHLKKLFDKADEFASDFYNRPEMKEYGPFNLYYWVVRMGIDSEIAYFMPMDEMIKKFQPSEIHLKGTLISSLEIELITGEYGCGHGRNVIGRHESVLRMLSAKHGVSLTVDISDDETAINEALEPTGSLWGKLKNSRFAQSLYLAFQHRLKKDNMLKQGKKIKDKAFFTACGWGVDLFSSYFENIVYGIDSVFSKLKKRDTKKSFPEFDCKALFEFLDGDLREADLLFGFKVSEIIKYYFSLLSTHFWEVLENAEVWLEFLKKEKTKYIVYSSLSYFQMRPILMASKWKGDVVNVTKIHGGCIWDLNNDIPSELKYADIAFTDYKEWGEYFKSKAKEYEYSTICEFHNVLFKSKKRLSPAKKKLVYIPQVYVVGKLLEPVNIYGPDFFRMHLKILEYLNSIKDFEVVCKFRPNSRRFHYPLKKYLANFSNIRFSEKKLGEEVKDASYCLLDIPSSSLWDVIQLNVPCQSLLYSKFHCRESGLKLFAEYLTLFSDVDSVDEVVREIWEEKRFYSGNFEALGFEEKTNDEIFSLFENTLHGKQGNANL